MVRSADGAKGMANAYSSHLCYISSVVDRCCWALTLHLRPEVVQQTQKLGGADKWMHDSHGRTIGCLA